MFCPIRFLDSEFYFDNSLNYNAFVSNECTEYSKTIHTIAEALSNNQYKLTLP
jgi:hypothetical protein